MSTSSSKHSFKSVYLVFPNWLRDSKAEGHISFKGDPQAMGLPMFLILNETDSGEVFLPLECIVWINDLKK